jgi:predicted alpha/beta-fold hydrolase
MPIECDRSYRPSWWLPSGHLQTIWRSTVPPPAIQPARREVLATPDGDEIVVDHVESTPATVHREAGVAPRLVVLHGLEGSSASPRSVGLAHQFQRRGWNATLVNLRGCARDPDHPERVVPNRLPRLYHPADTDDLDLVVRTLCARHPGAPLFVAGFSWGANLVVKWLGERRPDHPVVAAAAVSGPFDMAASAAHATGWMASVYLATFMATLSPKLAAMRSRFPVVDRILGAGWERRIRRVADLDSEVYAPLCGFAGVDDFHRRASCIDGLERITVPTLCICAEDDPFNPPDVLPRAARRASPAVQLIVTRAGGHVGFHEGAIPGRGRWWADERVGAWMEDRLADRRRARSRAAPRLPPEPMHDAPE